MEQLDGNESKDFDYVAPNQPEYLYEKEVSESAPRRARAIGAVTTTILVAGGLVGGAAFAMGNLNLNAAPASVESATATTDATAAVATSSSAEATPTATASATSSPRTIAVPPASFSDEDGERKFSKPSVGSGEVSTATPAPVVTGAPSFGGGDDGDDHHEGGGRQPRPLRTPGSFSNDD